MIRHWLGCVASVIALVNLRVGVFHQPIDVYAKLALALLFGSWAFGLGMLAIHFARDDD